MRSAVFCCADYHRALYHDIQKLTATWKGMWTSNFLLFSWKRSDMFSCRVGTKNCIILPVTVPQLKQPLPWQRRVWKCWLWGRTGVMTSIWIVLCVGFLFPFKRVKMYLIAQNPFRGEGESLPIHLNLRGWDTSGPNSCWHPTWLWKQTTGDWALLPFLKRHRDEQNKSLHILHL